MTYAHKQLETILIGKSIGIAINRAETNFKTLLKPRARRFSFSLKLFCLPLYGYYHIKTQNNDVRSRAILSSEQKSNKTNE